ncbi:MAG: AI-2E family transporter [Longimicrobiales bacterium]
MYLDTDRQRVAVLITLLGIGAVVALAPFLTGLIGTLILYVTFRPLNEWFGARVRPTVSAGITTALAVFIVLIPGLSLAGMIVSQAQGIASGIVESPLVARLSDRRVWGFDVGPQLAQLGEALVGWIGTSAFSLIGTATLLALNLTIAFFGLYYLLLKPQEAWDLTRPYLPFTRKNTAKLRKRFRDVTNSTLIGTLLISLVQGLLTAVAFGVVGLPNAMFWGFVTAIFAILPVVGSGLVWGPGAGALLLEGRTGAAIGLVFWGIGVVGMVDNLIRPLVYRRWAHVHPMLTLVGAIAGVRYFGILGILIGPLALSYFFELIRMYRESYVDDEVDASEVLAVT